MMRAMRFSDSPKTCRACGVEKPRGEFYAHSDMADGLKGECKECTKARTKARYFADHEANKEYHRQRYASGAKPPQVVSKEKRREYNASKYQRNREKILAGVKKYQSENRAAANARKKAYKETKRGATPKWLTDHDKLVIEQKYLLAGIHGWVTGMKWHVDHVIPLRGATVSGLHVSDNLQVILAEENLTKSNRF
ncbi:hypothetical protein D3C87_991910 [compost metagenome]